MLRDLTGMQLEKREYERAESLFIATGRADEASGWRVQPTGLEAAT